LVDELARRFPEDTIVQFISLPTIRGQLALSKKGSAQEFVDTRILGCFLKNDEFGLGDRHVLSLK
jgi:hypothetical protein